MKNQPSLHECSQRVIFSKMKKDNSKKLVLLSYCLEDLTLKSLVDEAKSRNLPVEVLKSEKEIFNAVQKYNAKYILGFAAQSS